MKSPQPEQPPPPAIKPGFIKRKAVNLANEGLVKAESLSPERSLPLVVQPLVKRIDWLAWVKNNREFIENGIRKDGGILFRHFNISSATEFEQLTSAISEELLEYRERSSPRTQVTGNIYTSTDYPAYHSIFLHNENSYQQAWPLRIFFFCRTAPEHGGETPIADCRRIYKRLPASIIERFAEKRVMYVRNFGDGFGLPWQTVFQTTDKSVVEEHCRRAGIIAEWKEGERLRTRAVRPALARHPRTGEMVWFNHATFFHISTLSPAIREALQAEFKEEDNLPTNSFYGDGSPIEPSVLDVLREAYREEMVSFPWQQGDVLMLDNMLAAHGRAPYAGAREILVAMAEPCSWSEIERVDSGGTE
jgi:alpha-ketoglutarate-dependent taurine dioxygenase